MPTPAATVAPVVLTSMSGAPVALPNTGGAQGGEAAANMVFVLAAAALAAGTVVFVGSARKGAPEGSDAKNDKREAGNN